MIRRLVHKSRAFRDDHSGAAMVEFAISLPLLLLVIAIIVEGSRIAWTHQAAASGVRDAARYIARLAPSDICDGAANILDYQTDANDIVVGRMGDPSDRILPSGVNVIQVVPDLDCADVAYSTDQVPFVEVYVDLEIEFPFGGVFGLIDEPLEPITTRIADRSRIFGI
jgi:Flp pilus assembly protein TadG